MKYLKPILDHAEAARLRELMSPMVLAPHLLSPCWIRRHGWCTVLVEDKPYEEEISRISQAIRIMDIRDCLVAVSDELVEVQGQEGSGFPSVYTLTLCPEGLWEINATEDLWHFVIYPENRSFAILQGRLCYIVAGPREFVEAVVGGSLEDAWTEIEAVCSAELAANQPEGKILERMIREYKPNCLE